MSITITAYNESETAKNKSELQRKRTRIPSFAQISSASLNGPLETKESGASVTSVAGGGGLRTGVQSRTKKQGSSTKVWEPKFCISDGGDIQKTLFKALTKY